MSAPHLLALPALLLVAVFVPAASGLQASGAVGTLDTIAGPGVCDGPTVVDPASLEVGGLAVGPEGTVWYEIGLLEQGRVARVKDRNEVQLRETTTNRPGEATAENEDIAPFASRIALDGDAGIVAATRTALYRVVGSPTILAGQPLAPGEPAGSPSSGETGSGSDGGPIGAARFNRVISIATDGQGNVVVADELDAATGAFTIRFLNRSGQPITFYRGSADEITVSAGAIDTIAGAPAGPTPAEGAPQRGRTVDLRSTTAPAMAAMGSLLYVAMVEPVPDGVDRAMVQAINVGTEVASAHGVSIPPGEVALVAGGSAVGFGGDGGPARAAQFGPVPGITVSEGNLYLVDEAHHRVRRVDPAGVIITVVGVGATGPDDGGFNGNGRPGTETRLNRPFDVEVGPAGELYISDRGNAQVRSLDVSGAMRAVPGAGRARQSMCVDGGGERGGEVRRGGVRGLAGTPDGGIYAAYLYQPDVKRVGPDGIVTRVAGTRTDQVCLPSPPGCPVVDGPATSSRFDRPISVAGRPGEGVYVYDGGSRRIRFVNMSAEPVTLHGVDAPPGHVVTVAGDGGEGGGGDGGPALAAQLSGEGSIAFHDGELLIADTGNKRVRRVDEAGVVSTVVGEAGQGGCCLAPVDVVADATGNLYIADSPTSIPTDLAVARTDLSEEPPNRVFFLNRGQEPATVHGQSISAGEARLVAGAGGIGVASEGSSALESQLLRPLAVAVDGDGDLYIADDADNTVLRVDAAGTITTLAGTGTFGFNGDGLPGKLSTLNSPSDLDLDACGNLLIADLGNDRIRRYNLRPPCTPGSGTDDQGSGFPLGLPMYVIGGVALVGGALMLRRVGRGRAGAP